MSSISQSTGLEEKVLVVVVVVVVVVVMMVEDKAVAVIVNIDVASEARLCETAPAEEDE